MARPKVFHGGGVGLKLPLDINLRLRAAALETGKSLSELIRETLAARWGTPRPQADREARNG